MWSPTRQCFGPPTFLLYINDLPNVSKFYTILFADDTTLQMSHSDLSELFSIANYELNKTCEWFKANLLTLNTSKTKFMIFSSSQNDENLLNFSLSVGGIKIERIGSDCPTKYFKFVGHHLDDKLSWQWHIGALRRKLSFTNYTIGKLKHFAPVEIKRLLYFALFESQISFGIVSYGHSLRKFIKPIQLLQNKCIKLVAGASHGSKNINTLYKMLRVLKFDDLMNLNCNIVMHSQVYKKTTVNLQGIFQELLSERNKSFCLQKTRLKRFEAIPSYCLPKIWNNNPISIKRLQKKSQLISHLKKYFFEIYN